MTTFEETGLEAKLLSAVKKLGFVNPTPIQAKAIPHLLTETRDLIATAQTGTGKTAAFGLPAIQLTDVDLKATQTLILNPTRELCVQIAKDLVSYAKHSKGLEVVAVYGGSSIETQIRELRRGGHIVVATPGRAKDLIKRKKLKLDQVRRVILDEADEMLSMGFKEDIEAILSKTPEDKQTILFSATMSKGIIRITKKFMQDALQIAVAKENVGANNVEHLYYMVNAKDKYDLLKRLADINIDIYGIVFCRTRRETKEIANKLTHDGYNADALHGELSQAQRDVVMQRFRKRHLQILVATDVAARGLDVEDLTHVINFSLPDDPEVYTHRSGRTGRAGKSGVSIAIIHTREQRKLRDIERESSIKFTRAMAPSGKDICAKQLYALIEKIEKVHVDEAQIEPFLPPIYEKLSTLSREELIKHFVSAEFNRFLDYYKNAHDLNVGEGSKRDRGTGSERGGRSSRREKSSWDDRGDDRKKKRDRSEGDTFRKSGRPDRQRADYTRLFINAGSKNDLNPARLMGLINESLGSDDAQIGKIEIMKKFSFFEVSTDVSDKVIKKLNGEIFERIPLIIEESQKKPDISEKKYKTTRSKRRSFTGKGGGKSHRKGGSPKGKSDRKKKY